MRFILFIVLCNRDCRSPPKSVVLTLGKEKLNLTHCNTYVRCTKIRYRLLLWHNEELHYKLTVPQLIVNAWFYNPSATHALLYLLKTSLTEARCIAQGWRRLLAGQLRRRLSGRGRVRTFLCRGPTAFATPHRHHSPSGMSIHLTPRNLVASSSSVKWVFKVITYPRQH